MTDRLVELLHVAPAIGSAIFQPYRGCRIRRLSIPTDCELIQRTLNPGVPLFYRDPPPSLPSGLM
jgi:hypothetical protein